MNEQEEKDLRFDPEDPDPERLEEQDLLGFMEIAEKEIIPEIESFKPPLIYGIYGRWGSGKTFMMRALEKCFNKEEREGKYKTVWFDPWWYDHADKEQLFVGLLNKVQRTIQPKGNKIKKVGLNIVAGGLSAVRVAADAALSWASGKIGASGPTTKDAEEYFKQFQKLLRKNLLDAVDAVEKTRDILYHAIREVLKDDETLVLFIDDLDRCLPDRAILLLDQLKNFLYLPRVITVLGIDDKAFGKMLRTHYKYTDGVNNNEPSKDMGHQYLEKIIRKHYRLGPGIVGKLLESYKPLSELQQHEQTVERMLYSSKFLTLSLRQINRSLEKFAYIYNHYYSDEVAQKVVVDCGLDVSPSSLIFGIYQRIRGKRASEQGLSSVPPPQHIDIQHPSEEHSEAIYEAILVYFWGVIVLANIYDFPLDLNTFPKELTKNLQPPPHQLNKVYEFFRIKGWL